MSLVLTLLAATAIQSGLFGTVVVYPAQPVCEVGKPCSRPAANVVLTFSRNGRVVRARTDRRGHYRVALARGTYTVSTTPPTRIGRGLEPRRVRVGAGYRRVNFTVDTGIR